MRKTPVQKQKPNRVSFEIDPRLVAQAEEMAERIPNLTKVSYVTFLDTIQTTETYVTFGIDVDSPMYQAIKEQAEVEDRPVSNMVGRLLKTHPDIQAAMKHLEGGEVGV